MLISFIIPVYNSEKYLKQCIDSILDQTYKRLEIILVDDESQDQSGEICDYYEKQDSRVKVIHKKNGGTADARNKGIDAAVGDYITFVDNDDYWNDNNVLVEIVEQIKQSQADVLMFNTMEYWQNKDKFTKSSKACQRNKIVFQPKDVALKEIISNGLFYRAVWAKIIRTDLIKKNNLYFTKGIRNEDTEWSGKLLLKANSFDWFDKVFYVYRKGTGQAQTDVSVSLKEVRDLKNIIENFLDSTEVNNLNEKDKYVFYSYLAYPFAVLMGQCRIIKDKKLIHNVKNHVFLLKYDLDPSVNMVNKIYTIFGYTITGILLKWYLKR